MRGSTVREHNEAGKWVADGVPHMEVLCSQAEVTQSLVDDTPFEVAICARFRVSRQRNALFDVRKSLVPLHHATVRLSAAFPSVPKAGLDLDGSAEVLDRICKQVR